MILQSPVYKNINKKTQIFGFELFDSFLVLATFAILNFILAGSIFTWFITASVAVILYFGKKDKPEGFLLDSLQFIASPKVFSASSPDFEWVPFKKISCQKR